MLATYFICYYLDNGERVYSTVAVKLLSISVGRLHHSLINHDFVLFIIFVQLTTTLMYALCLYRGYAIDAHPRNATIMA